MATLNELKYIVVDHTKAGGALNDLEMAWLGTGGYTGTLDERWIQKFLKDSITAGSFNGMAKEWLLKQGYDGTLNERWIKFWAAMAHDQSHGDDMVQNGDFDNSDHWVLGTGWTISGKAAHNHGVVGVMSQIIAGLEAGHLYTLTVTVHGAHTAGLHVILGGGTEVIITTDGQTIIPIVAGAGDKLEFKVTEHDGFSGIVDDVKLQKVISHSADDGVTTADNDKITADNSPHI